MPTSFRTILVPVDFSINTEVAIRKALDMADTNGAWVYLLHIWKGSTMARQEPHWSDQKDTNSMAWAEGQLRKWKETIMDEVPDLHVITEVVCSRFSIQKTIENKTGVLCADLVVIGKKSNHSWFPFLNTVIPSELAHATGCAVLTAKPGALRNRIKTLVVPVSTVVPTHKLEAIGVLCRKFRIKVHLVTFVSDENIPTDFSASTLLKTYQWLQNALHCQVEYAVLHGSNKAKATLQYAERIDADILLVHPKTETRTGWFNQRISDVLPPASKVQVLNI